MKQITYHMFDFPQFKQVILFFILFIQLEVATVCSFVQLKQIKGIILGRVGTFLEGLSNEKQRNKGLSKEKGTSRSQLEKVNERLHKLEQQRKCLIQRQCLKNALLTLSYGPIIVRNHQFGCPSRRK